MVPEYRERLNKPDLSVVWSNLSLFDPDTISTYLRLDADVEEFKSSEIPTIEWFRQRLTYFDTVIKSLRSLIQGHARNAGQVLETTEEPQT